MNVDVGALSSILRGCMIIDPLDTQKDPKVMLVEDWVFAQSKDPVIREIDYL